MEVKRVTKVSVVPQYETVCDVCGVAIVLRFNGGELDSVPHCGLVYKLDYAQIDFVVETLSVNDLSLRSATATTHSQAS